MDISLEAVEHLKKIARFLECKPGDEMAVERLKMESANRELSRQLQAEKARADKAEADLNETFVDDTGLAWSRPTAEAYYLACRLRDRLKAQLTAANEKLASMGWRTDAPQVPEKKSVEFIVACSYDGGKPFVTTCHYLNTMYLDTEDDTLLDQYDEDEEGVPFSGWHWRKEHADYDGVYEPLTKYCRILAWMPMPSFIPPDATSPTTSSSQEGQKERDLRIIAYVRGEFDPYPDPIGDPSDSQVLEAFNAKESQS